MNKIIVALFCFLVISFGSQAQNQGLFHEGEYGVTFGASHYFGDLNTRSALNRPNLALGLFFRKQFGNYIGLRVAGRYTQLAYSDKYSNNLYQKTRNLNFNTDIYEFAVQGDFNFFKFISKSEDARFTPYVTLGVGFFAYDPYVIDQGKKVYLRPLGTEGQSIGYQGRSEYSSMALCIPFGIGVKYSLSDRMNLSFEVSQRFTSTDYIDDVSTTYVGGDKFQRDVNGGLTPAGKYQDMSVGQSLGKEGRQRGWSQQNDQYVIAEIGISFNINSYRCPTQ